MWGGDSNDSRCPFQVEAPSPPRLSLLLLIFFSLPALVPFPFPSSLSGLPHTFTSIPTFISLFFPIFSCLAPAFLHPCLTPLSLIKARDKWFLFDPSLPPAVSVTLVSLLWEMCAGPSVPAPYSSQPRPLSWPSAISTGANSSYRQQLNLHPRGQSSGRKARSLRTDDKAPTSQSGLAGSDLGGADALLVNYLPSCSGPAHSRGRVSSKV